MTQWQATRSSDAIPGGQKSDDMNAPGKGCRKRIMAVFSYAPWPLRQNGISIRYYPVLVDLIGRHDLKIFVLGDRLAAKRAPPDEFRADQWEILANDPTAQALGSRMSARVRGLVPWGVPYRLTRPDDIHVVRLLLERISSFKPDVLLWVGREHGAVLSALLSEGVFGRSVVDFVDSPTLIRKRELEIANRPDWCGRYDQWKTRNWERRTRHQASQTVYVADPDRRAASPANDKNTVVIPNGFRMESARQVKRLASGPILGFFGHMAYPPNVRAAQRLYEKIYLPLKSLYPDLRLAIIGRSPTPEVKALHDGEDVFVTGEVDNIAAYISGLDICVFPLASGAGLQNKVLEALWLRRPCVVSSFVGRAAQMEHERDGLLVDTDAEFRAAIELLLKDPGSAARLGESGRRLIEEKYDMARVLGQFRQAIEA